MATPAERVDGQANSTQVALIAVLVVVLLGLLWFMFLRGGGEEEEAAPAPTPAEDVFEDLPGLEPEEPEDGASGPRGPLETFEVFAPRDPFVPLIAAQEVATGETGGTGIAEGTGDTGATGTGDGTGDTDGTAGTVDGGNGGAPTDGGGEQVGTHTVQLVDSFRRNGNEVVQVEVDGTVYTVREGETFAETFQVLSIDGECASLLHGDDEFTLCEGEEILK